MNNQYFPRKEQIKERREVDKQSELGFQTIETTCSRLEPLINLYHQDSLFILDFHLPTIGIIANQFSLWIGTLTGSW